MPPPPPPAAARANLHNAQDDASLPPQGSNPPQTYPQQPSTYAADRGWLFDPRAFGQWLGRRLAGSLWHAGNHDHHAYADPNVVPVGATDVAPAGPATASPYDVSNAPAGPPPGYAGPGPSAPMTISSRFRLAEEVG